VGPGRQTDRRTDGQMGQEIEIGTNRDIHRNLKWQMVRVRDRNLFKVYKFTSLHFLSLPM
jgi:hypothetical protein